MMITNDGKDAWICLGNKEKECGEVSQSKTA